MTSPAPGLELYQKVRAAFIVQGTTLKAWCRHNDIHLANVRNALTGSWNGPAGRRMRARVVAASKVEALLS